MLRGGGLLLVDNSLWRRRHSSERPIAQIAMRRRNHHAHQHRAQQPCTNPSRCCNCAIHATDFNPRRGRPPEAQLSRLSRSLANAARMCRPPPIGQVELPGGRNPGFLLDHGQFGSQPPVFGIHRQNAPCGARALLRAAALSEPSGYQFLRAWVFKPLPFHTGRKRLSSRFRPAVYAGSRGPDFDPFHTGPGQAG